MEPWRARAEDSAGAAAPAAGGTPLSGYGLVGPNGSHSLSGWWAPWAPPSPFARMTSSPWPGTP
eukprot:9457944-Alexandrium_andersonii.AAC.1